jgi:hypothetical protein
MAVLAGGRALTGRSLTGGRIRVKIRRSLLLVAAGIVFSVQAAGAGNSIRAGGNITVGFPTGEFGDNVDRVASGLSGYALVGVGDLPLSLGGSFGFLTHGSERIGRFQVGPYVGDMVTRNKLLTGHGVIRVQNTGAAVAPFLDILVGFRRFYSTTEIKIGFDVPDIDMDSDSWVLSYGAGAGLTYGIYESAGSEDEGSGGYVLCLDFGVRYLFGSESDDIVDIDSVLVVDDGIMFDTISSRTDMFTVHAGMSFTFH